MADPRQLNHRYFGGVGFKYKSFDNPVSVDPMFESGTNVMHDIRGVSSLRPGFANTLESSPTAFVSVQRVCEWDTWSGSHVWMVCDVDTVAKVYALTITNGIIPASFTLIHTSASATPFDFVSDNDWVFFSNGTDAKKWKPGQSVVNSGIQAPATAPSLGSVSGTLDSYTGYYWGYTFYDSISGHESSMSPLSACSGVQQDKKYTLTPTVTPSRSGDSFDKIRWYRTTDGGSVNPTSMQFVSEKAVGSPNLVDEYLDDELSTTGYAPALLRNDPPPAMHGMISYAGRIWGFVDNKLYYSGQEEVANGVPQECFPSGLDGNYYAFDGPVRAIAPMSDGVAVFLSNRIWKIEGDSLDTFRKYKLLDKRGTFGPKSVAAMDSSVAWIDTSCQIMLSDSGEIGQDIRPDLGDADSAVIEIHVANEFHWIVVSDVANSKLYVYNLDTAQWNVPWTVKLTALCSGRIGANNTVLVGAVNGTTLAHLNPSSASDNGTTYTSSATMMLSELHPEGNPDYRGVLDHVSLEGNQYSQPSSCSILLDDDPGQATYTALSSSAVGPDLRTQGAYVIQSQFKATTDTANRAARRVSARLNWPAPSNPANIWKWYTLDIAHHQHGK